MKIPKYLVSQPHAITITVIGCGGTGSALLQHLARINKSLIALGRNGIVVVCIDPDVVSVANLGRQLFTPADIGRPKAVVMVERINRFYSTNWIAIPKAFDNDIIYMECLPGNIIITCVDKIPVRRFVYNYVANSVLNNFHEHIQNIFWIDTGNRKDFGQVLLSSEKPRMDNIFDMFPNMETDTPVDDTPSCSLAEALDKQDLFINSLIALTSAELVWEILSKPEIDWKGAFINLTKQIPIRRIKA